MPIRIVFEPNGDPSQLRELIIEEGAGKLFDFSGEDFTGFNLQSLDRYITGADFSHCNLTNVNFGHSNLTKALFINATLVNASLFDTNCGSASFHGADVRSCNFLKTNLGNTKFADIKNLPRAKNLELCYLHTVGSIEDFDKVKLTNIDKYLSWEKIRRIGKLPIFGASYLTLVLMPIVFYLIVFYNSNVTRLTSLLDKILLKFPNEELLLQYTIWKEGLELIPLPSGSIVFFISTVFLAIAQTLYVIYCPSRVKDFSLEQWKYSNGQDEIFYVSLSWTFEFARVLSYTLYILGGCGAVLFIGSKLIKIGIFIYTNT